MINLKFLNKLKEKQRVRNGKPAKMADLSMEKHFEQQADGAPRVEKPAGEAAKPAVVASEEEAANLDKTDVENDEFTYVL